MELTLVQILVVGVLLFLVAALYSSVGHGGASGYLAVLSFFAVSPSVMSSTALVLNVLVAGVGMALFMKAGHYSFRKAWPFVLLSIPGAFLGGYLRVSDKIYSLLLAAVLLAAAYRLATASWNSLPEEELRKSNIPVAVLTGGGIGVLSGLVGVGGGIFLSPLMILMKWATTKQTAAISAFFIVVNSLAGLGGRFMRDGIEFGSLLPFVGFTFLGGLAGSHLGANKFSGMYLRRILAAVLLTAALKLMLTSVR